MHNRRLVIRSTDQHRALKRAGGSRSTAVVRGVLLVVAALVVLASSCLAASAEAEPRLDNGAGLSLHAGAESRQRVGPQISVLLDPTGSLQLENVVRMGGLFRPADTSRGFGFHPGTLWVRVQVHNTSGESWQRWLVSDQDRQASVGFHLVRADRSTEAAVGTNNPPADALADSAPAIFRISLERGETATVFVAYSGPAATVVNLTFWEPSAYLEHVTRVSAAKYFLVGLGGLMILGCAVAARLQSLRGLMHGCACSLAAMAYIAARDAMFPDAVLQLLNMDHQRIMQVTAMVFVGFASQFVKAFIVERQTAGNTLTMLNGLSLVAGMLSFLPLWDSFPKVAVYFSGLAIVVITIVAVRNAVHGGSSTRVYLVGWLLLLFAILSRIVHAIGILPLHPDLLFFLAPLAFSLSSVVMTVAVYRYAGEIRFQADAADRRLREREATERDRLENAVAERSRELKLALAEVEKASREKSGFLSMMAHEIRSPLHAVIGHARLLMRNRSASNDDGARAIERAAGRLMKLVDQTLSFSKGEQAAFEMDPGPVAVMPFLREIARSLEVASGSSLQRLGVRTLGPVPGVIEVDEQHLRQVLENLIGNALKYAPHGPIDICVQALPGDQRSAEQLDGDSPPLHRLRFSVVDQGPGIALADQPFVFEPFSRISTTNQVHGLGLGLTICRQLLRSMGSDIQLESEVGEGSRFFFDLVVPELREETAPSEFSSPEWRTEASPPAALLEPARNMLKLGQLVAIERWAQEAAHTHPEFGPYMQRIIACCLAVDLDGIAVLLGREELPLRA